MQFFYAPRNLEILSKPAYFEKEKRMKGKLEEKALKYNGKKGWGEALLGQIVYIIHAD